VKYKVRARFNPYHDPKDGKFTFAAHDVADAPELKRYMHQLSKGGYHPNIMNLTVAGKAIFNPHMSLGVGRKQMPQIPTASRPDFLSSLPHQLVHLDPTKLNPTQAQLDGYKTAKFYTNGEKDVFRPPIVSSDDYVIDGHHNWASRVIRAVANDERNPSMMAYRIKMPHDLVLARAHEYATEHGFEAKPIHKFNPNHDPKTGRFAPKNVTFFDPIKIWAGLPKPKFKPKNPDFIREVQQWDDILDSETWDKNGPNRAFTNFNQSRHLQAEFFASFPNKYKVKVKFNPNHRPAGPGGGQFTSGIEMHDGVVNDPAMAEFNSIFGPFNRVPYGEAFFYQENEAAHQLNEQLYTEHSKWFAQHPQVASDVMDYMGEDYGPLNTYLRTGKLPNGGYGIPEMKARSMAARLERGINDAPELPDGTVLYRAFRSDRVMERVQDGSLVGGVFQDRAFLSTTTNPAVLGTFYENKDNKSNAVLMRITTRDGTQGLYTPSVWNSENHRPGEYEVLLNKSTPLYVSKVTPLKSGGVIVDADVYGEHHRVKFNPNHVPAGSPTGGQFTSANDPDGDGQGDLNLPVEHVRFSDVFPNKHAESSDEAINRTDYAAAIDERMREPTQKFMGTLSPGEAAVVDNYSDNMYLEMNGLLRGTRTLQESRKEVIQGTIDTMSAVINGAPAHPEVTVYRAFRSSDLVQQGEGLVGQTITEKGFMSTTTSTSFVNRWAVGRLFSGEVVGVRLRIPPEVPSLYIPENAYGSKEYEFVLPPGTGMHVTNVTKLSEGGILIDADAVKK
jgi:hypothetical protein